MNDDDGNDMYPGTFMHFSVPGLSRPLIKVVIYYVINALSDFNMNYTLNDKF